MPSPQSGIGQPCSGQSVGSVDDGDAVDTLAYPPGASAGVASAHAMDDRARMTANTSRTMTVRICLKVGTLDVRRPR
jgi:hypothetical protein